MRAKFCTMLITFGLAATDVANAGDLAAPAPMVPNVELIIDSGVDPTDLRFTLPKRTSSFSDRGDLTGLSPHDLAGLDLALSSPGILFGVPHGFLTFAVHFGDPATTGVVFPGLAK